MGKTISPAGGYTGRILRVNLTKKSSTVEPLNYEEARRFVGGRGLAAKILFDELLPGTDPLGPENKLIFATGPVTGTLAPGSSRYMIVTKSPETNLFLDTYAGGHFPAEIKYAGYDLIIIEGKAERPTYLWINDGNVELRDASHLWGKLSSDAETSLKKEAGDDNARVAVIGPGGENLSNLAIVQNDYWHRCGRGGAGAVMGSKKLKAVVIRGSQGLRTADPQALMDYILTTWEDKITKGTMAKVAEGLMMYGTRSGVPGMNAANVLATHNFQEGQFQNRNKPDFLPAMRSLLGFRDASCLCCSLACCKFSKIKSGPYAGTKGGSLQQETHTLMTGNLGIDSEEFSVAVNDLCDNLGIDTMGTGVVIGFAMECYERGLLRQEELGGIDLRFGNQDAVLKILPMIAHRQGIGDLLAQGVKIASEKIGHGSEEFAMHGKGLAYPAYRPGISSPAFALAYAIADRGACHRRARPHTNEQNLPPFSIEGRPQLVKALYDERIPWHCALCCDFPTFVIGLDFKEAAFILSVVTGWNFTEEELQILADRVASLVRAFNQRDGATRADDTLAPRSFQVESTGPTAGKVLTKEMLNTMLDEYYALRGWDKDGVPTTKTLKKLGLEAVDKELQKHRKAGGAG
ncbi:aldehyde ferredoxin oxidoreductase family protein [Chloroflexota bacterium]